LPTALPRPPRVKPKRVEQKRSLFGVVLNTFMVVSAVALTFVVLVQEQRYALGQPGLLAADQTALQIPLDTTGESQVIPPLN